MPFNSKVKLALFLILGSLAGCTQPDQASSGEAAGAQFFVKDLGAERTELKVSQTKSGWLIPKAAVYTIKACLKERATNKDIQGHRFQVKTPEGVIFETLDSTDSEGCFRWQETFPYNVYASKPYFVPVEREVVGSGVYEGHRKVEFAINPWALGEMARDKGESLIFLFDGIKQRDQLPAGKSAPKEAAKEALSGDYVSPQVSSGDEFDDLARVWVDKVSVKTIQRRTLAEGVVMDINLVMNPVLKLKDTDGNILTRSIPKGSFDVSAHLVVTDTGTEEDKKLIITESDKVSGHGQIDMGQLSTQLHAKWTKRAHTGNVTLVLTLTPKGLPHNSVEPFQGLFELGGLNSLTGNSSAHVLPTCGHPSDRRDIYQDFSDPQMKDKTLDSNNSSHPCQNVKEFLASASNYDDLVKQGYASQNEPLIFDTLKLRFVSVLPGETATQRVVLYSASTCIRNRFDGSPMANIPFVIEYLDNDKYTRSGTKEVLPEFTERVTTNSTGCLMWNSKVYHNYYGSEEFKWHTVQIRTEKSNHNFKKIKRFALNPWDDKFTFGWDAEEFDASLMKSKKAKSRFFLPHFSYHTVRFLYNIDPYMELEVKKTVLLDIEPRVLRYAGIVNARKQTEPLRDGIYLMKVAIQKNFLDPTERSVDLAVGKRHSKSLNQEVPAVILNSLGPVKPREYITTDMSLVRVVDGHLIHPIELTMRDLRLMRVRSNFLIQLETVDERAIQTHDVFNRLMKNELDGLVSKREKERRKEELRNKKGQANLEPTEAEELELLEVEASQVRAKYQSAFSMVREQLENMPLISSDFVLDKNLLEPIQKVLQVNDFTDVKLPSKEEADLNVFVEKAGLEARTFVGPVIYLSNAYSDSMRATDNLDEAKCSDVKISSEDEKKEEESATDLELKALGKEYSLLLENNGVDGKAPLKAQRKNDAYRYSPYYGALTHLCGAQVDDLIKREKEYETNYHDIMPTASSKANLARSFGFDYVSLTDEPLTPLPDDSCEKNKICRDLRSKSFSLGQIEQKLNKGFEKANNLGWLNHRDRESVQSLASLSSLLLPPLQFGNTTEDPHIYKGELEGNLETMAACTVLTDLAMARLKLLHENPETREPLRSLVGKFENHEVLMGANVFSSCVRQQQNGNQSIIVDEKLKVMETGSDYVFRGGLQMNFNVNNSVSISRSNSWGGSIGLDDIPSAVKGVVTATGIAVGAFFGPPGAFVGGTVGLMAGTIVEAGLSVIKPISVSRSASDSNSDGDSISKGTYLVSQMAKFDVPIEKYQRCRVIRLSEDFTRSVLKTWGLGVGVAPFISKGFMTCSGTFVERGQAALRVPETYFYFTQHFTEGDMLDQADLYNHPWLLGMRGLRDFGSFVREIEMVERPSLAGFWTGLWDDEKKPLAWPLDHMAITYRQLAPTFPGFYTVASKEESITNFPLNERFSKVETDINGEVNCKMEKTIGQRPVCAEKMANPSVPEAQ